jgi:hypothetical protein
MRLPSDFFAGLKLALASLPVAVGGFYLFLAGYRIVGGLIAIVGCLVLLAGFFLHVALAVERLRAAGRKRDDSRD